MSFFSFAPGCVHADLYMYMSVCVPIDLWFDLCRYRPSVSVERITSELKFGSRDECVQFLIDANAVLDRTQNTLDCKLTAANV